MSLAEYIASKVGYTIVIIIFILIVLLAIPGGYNLYLDTTTGRGEKSKYIFDDMGYDTSGTADAVSIICAVLLCFGVFYTMCKLP